MLTLKEKNVFSIINNEEKNEIMEWVFDFFIYWGYDDIGRRNQGGKIVSRSVCIEIDWSTFADRSGANRSFVEKCIKGESLNY